MRWSYQQPCLQMKGIEILDCHSAEGNSSCAVFTDSWGEKRLLVIKTAHRETSVELPLVTLTRLLTCAIIWCLKGELWCQITGRFAFFTFLAEPLSPQVRHQVWLQSSQDRESLENCMKERKKEKKKVIHPPTGCGLLLI